MIDLNQERIVLYHGSNVSFEQVSLIHSKDKREVSFHTGKAIQCLKVINKEILGE